VWNNFKSMPGFLQVISGIGFLFLCVAFMTVIPPNNIQVNGQPITFTQYWLSGLPIIGLLVFLSIGSSFILFTRKIKYSREIYVAMLFVLNLILLYLIQGDPEAVSLFIALCVQIAILALYLFKSEGVKSYLSSDS